MITKTILTGLLLFTMPALSSAASGWMDDYEAAKKKSQETGKPILANFTGSDWCGWCIKLHKEVFNKQEFKSWAGNNVILLELDYPNKKKQSDAIKQQNQKLKKKYGIEGYPTLYLMDAKGKTISPRMGYAPGGPKPWVAQANQVVAPYRESHKPTNTAASSPTPTLKGNEKAVKNADFREWSNVSGSALFGRLVSKSSSDITLELNNGKFYRIPQHVLSPEDISYVQTK